MTGDSRDNRLSTPTEKVRKTPPPELVLQTIPRCGIRHVITARALGT